MIKLSIKWGDIHIDYEGPEEFLKSELPQLISSVAGHGTKPGSAQSGASPAKQSKPGASLPTDLSVSTIAQKLGVKTGPELIMAAAVSLSGASGTFTKRQLRERTREATTFFRSAYNNNFDKYVTRLVKKGSLNHTGGENYAVAASEKSALAAKLSA